MTSSQRHLTQYGKAGHSYAHSDVPLPVYVQRALGHLFGLAQLLAFACQEVRAEAGPLVCHSTYAVLDTEGGWTNAQVEELMVRCKRMRSKAAA